MPALLAACPSFGAAWQERLAKSPKADGQGVYVDLGAFATHLVALLERGETAEFPIVFETVERLWSDGDDGIRYALRVGLLEAIGNVASGREGWRFAGRFRHWLGPAATEAWDDLHTQWGTSELE